MAGNKSRIAKRSLNAASIQVYNPYSPHSGTGALGVAGIRLRVQDCDHARIATNEDWLMFLMIEIKSFL
ncbi:hypothetical protein N7495_007504 [Penicillium taxi]|uniref:uncharacterized protein n=1 Tax=Penicillium taxi TaxID=168475 RepID=UPI002545AB78|nr:uncharacterized protein N7495_007504 [Penicillium taxi]KAJ5887463.1 hypothetical protein N7495_007504 [Penicillium taxi]